MKNLKSAIGAVVMLGAGSLVTPAGAGTVFKVNFPPPVAPNPDTFSRNAASGAGTSGSFAAASTMGAEGYSNYLPPSNWESVITTACTTQTASHPTSGQVGTSMWPSACNPGGMVVALNSGLPFPAAHWVTSIRTGVTPTATDPNPVDPAKPAALNAVVTSLQTYHSPAVIPMFGQADHWIAVTEVTATANGANWTINGLKYYDGGPTDGSTDTGFNSYAGAGVHGWNGNVFSNGYYSVITAINQTCDPCIADPYYSKWVLLFEPPLNQRQSFAPVSAVFARAPAVAFAMSETVAQASVLRSLVAAGIDADPQFWSVVSAGVAGPAVRVNAVFPSGLPWSYYLVPILSKTDTNLVTAYVQLAADDGSYEAIHVLPRPTSFAAVSATKATVLAGSVLAPGESLAGGTLTWDPRTRSAFAKAPSSPYYEFGVVSATNPNKDVATVRVRLNDGAVVRSE